MNIGFSMQGQYNLPITQVIALLKKAGFSAVSPLWSPELDMQALADSVKEHGMIIQSLHAPHKGISQLWKPTDPATTPIYTNILNCLDACAQFHVPIMVIHGWQGLIYTFPAEPLDFRCFDSIVTHSKKVGVCIAFENLEGEEYLHALLERYTDCAHVGFCWDSGHDHCYPHKTDFLQDYGHRLIMTHINDNWGLRDPSGIPDGKDDLHLLPYDGNIVWEHAMYRLLQAPIQTTLNFELKIRSHSQAEADLLYLHLSAEEFFLAAGQRARCIADQYEAMIAKQS